MIEYRRIPRLIRFFCLSVLLCITGSMACNNESSRKELTTVKVGFTTNFLGEAAVFTAKEQGFFNDFGLEVELQHNPAGRVSLMALFREEVDIAHVAETPIVYTLLDSAYSEVQPVPSFQIFADMMYADEVQKIIARKDHGIQGPGDIVGKKIATFEDTQLDYFLDSFLLEHQIPKSSITFVNIEPAEHLEAIEQGKVDISANWEPFASNIQHRLGDNAVRLETKLTYSTLWLAVTLDSFAEQHPEVLTAYLRSLKKAQDYIKEHPEESRDLMARSTDVSIEVIESLWQKIDFELSLSERMLLLLEDQARWLQRNKDTDTTYINFKDLINFSPLREVHPDGITIIQ